MKVYALIGFGLCGLKGLGLCGVVVLNGGLGSGASGMWIQGLRSEVPDCGLPQWWGQLHVLQGQPASSKMTDPK